MEWVLLTLLSALCKHFATFESRDPLDHRQFHVHQSLRPVNRMFIKYALLIRRWKNLSFLFFSFVFQIDQMTDDYDLTWTGNPSIQCHSIYFNQAYPLAQARLGQAWIVLDCPIIVKDYPNWVYIIKNINANVPYVSHLRAGQAGSIQGTKIPA